MKMTMIRTKEEENCTNGRSSETPIPTQVDGFNQRADTFSSEADALIDIKKKKKPPILRSNTYHPSLARTGEVEKKNKSPSVSPQNKYTNQFHKLFKEIPEEEDPIETFNCALQRDLIFQGRMFVSENWICFFANFFGKDVKVAIPVLTVKAIKKQRSALLLPNAIGITSACEKHMFISFLARDAAYKALLSVCKQAEAVNENSSNNLVQLGQEQASSNCARPDAFNPTTTDGLRLELVPSNQTTPSTQSSSTSSVFEEHEESSPTEIKWKNGLHETDAISRPSSTQTAAPPAPSFTSRLQQKMSYLLSSTPRTEDQQSVHYILVVCTLLIVLLMVSSCYMAVKIASLEAHLTSIGMGPEQQYVPGLPDRSNLNPMSSADKVDLTNSELMTSLATLGSVIKNLDELLVELQSLITTASLS
ncbi:GRAM domain-containing protein 2B isoform X3 [Lampetra fluviatilis]